jgi:3',5'-cyclic-AMP phosphodiesterase
VAIAGSGLLMATIGRFRGRMATMIVFAQVSDLHLDGGEHSTERAERVMRYLNDLPVPLDAVLVTGDIADHGLPEEYEQASKLLSSPYPVLTCPGNHDVRSAYREVLLGKGGGDSPINRTHRVGEALFALCDSTIPGRNDGTLADETITWLDAVLSGEPDAPTFICFHHPPVVLHNPLVDDIRLGGPAPLAEVIARHPQVIAILCGHAHTAAASTFAGRPVLVAPGVVSTGRMPWEHPAIPGATGVAAVADYRLPPALAFHVLDGDRRLTTHYRVVI